MTVLAAVGLAQPTAAATVTWDGANGPWDTCTNWTGDSCPGAGDDVVIDTAVTVKLTATTTINSLTLGVSADNIASVLQFDYDAIGGSPLTVNGNVIMYGTSKITSTDNTTTTAYRASLDVNGNFELQSGATIDLDAKGFTGGGTSANGNGTSPGTHVTYAGGGGAHAGQGGRSSGSASNNGGASPYGSSTNPITLGSGGGGSVQIAGADGGGAVKIDVAGTFILDGVITTDGAAGSNETNGSGGGAGGSINIIVGSFGGSGTVTADGGNGGNGTDRDGGGGGAGRIYIRYTSTTISTSSFNTMLSAVGGSVDNSPDLSVDAVAGGNGSAMLLDVASDTTNFTDADGYIIDGYRFESGEENGTSPTRFRFNNLTVTGTGTSGTGLVALVNNTSASIVDADGTFILSNAAWKCSSVTTLQIDAATLTWNAQASDDLFTLTSCEAWTLNVTSSITSTLDNLTISTKSIDWNVPASSTLTLSDSTITTTSTAKTAFTIDDAITLNLGTADSTNASTVTSNATVAITTLTIYAGSTWSANSLGCAGGSGGTNASGPNVSDVCTVTTAGYGRNGTYAGGGGGNGGAGGQSVDGSASSTNGTAATPATYQVGAGGARGENVSGGAGGGYLKLNVSDTLTLSGTISAKGAAGGDNNNNGGGGGSGGSVWLLAGTLAGGATGDVTAKGGAGGAAGGGGRGGGGGGGGLIYIIYATDSSSWRSGLTSANTATGGAGGSGGIGAGTGGTNGTLTTATYSAPSTPTISSPANGATGQSRTLTVTTSAYSSDGAGHTTTSWQISDDNTFSDSDCSDTNIVGCHMTSSNKESIVVNSTNLTLQNALNGYAQLAPNTTYYVRARHTNAAGSSAWSSAISFTTTTNVAPSTPTNSSPANSATGVSKNPTLSASAYSNSDNDSQTSSAWVVYEAADCSGTADWSKSGDTSNLTSITVNTTNGTFADALSGKTTLKAHTVYSFQVRYNDPYPSGTSSYSSCTSFTTTNTAPTLDSSIANQSLTEDTNVIGAFDLDTYFSDVDFNDDDAYTCTASNGLAASLGTMTINSNRTVDFTLTANANGSDTIQFSCADGNNESTSSNAVTVTIAAVNDSPTLSSSISNQTTNEDTNLSSAFDLDNFFSDVDSGDSCTYSVINDFSLGTMSISSGAVSFALTANANGSDTVQFRCTDSSAATVDSNSVTITVTAVNDSPTLSSNISNQTTNEDTNLSSAFDLDNFFADIDTGDSCTYSVVDDFSKGTMTISSGAVSFAVTANANGSDTVKFRCTDTGSATVDSNSVTVTVTAVNDAPSVSGPVNISIDEGTKLVILVAGADNDGDNLALTVEDTSSHYSTQGITVGNLFTDAGDNSGVFEWTPQYDNNGSYATTFIANDGTTTGNKAITITVNDINSEPAFTDTLPTVAFVGGTTTDVIFDLDDYFTDADGDTLTYSVAGNDQVEAVITDGAVQLTAPASFGGTEALTFTATDALGATENSNAVVVTVTAGLSLETVDRVEGKTTGKGKVKVFDDSGNVVSWTAFPVGGSVPRLAEINDTGYVFVTKYRSGSTIHAYSLTGEVIKKKRLSPKLHWRKLATGDLDKNEATEEIVVATRRDSKIYFKVYAFKPNQAQFDLLYKAQAGIGPITDDDFQVTIQDRLIVLKDSMDKVVKRFRPL